MIQVQHGSSSSQAGIESWALPPAHDWKGEEVEVPPYSPGEHTFVIPRGVHEIKILAAGAQGGNCLEGGDAPCGFGGRGAVLQGTFKVKPFEIINILVGAQGQSNKFQGGGGGATVFTKTSRTEGSKILIAAGG